MKKTLFHVFLAWLCAASLLLGACTGETAPAPASENETSAVPTQSEEAVPSEAPSSEAASAAEDPSSEEAPPASSESVPETETPADENVGFTYEAGADGGLKLTSYTGSSAEPVIPVQIGGTPVTSIGDSCFAGLLCVERISVPEGISAIGDYAFECCGRLKKIYLSDSLRSIGDGAFSGCVSLTMVDLQEGLETIGRGAFLTCTSLVYLDLPESLKEIGVFACSGCHSLANVVFNGDAVTVIPDRLFYDCPSLASITLPKEVTSVGRRAFFGCQSLTSLYFAAPMTQVGEHAFEDCSSLQNVDFSAPAIERDVFAGCTSLNYFILAEGTTSIAYRAFRSSGVTDLDIPASVSEIAEGAFDNSQIGSVTLADESNYKLIDGSLYSADGKTLLCCFPEDPYAEEPAAEIVIPDGVETIAGYAFSCMFGAERVTLPASVKTVKAFAFSDSSVCEAVIPEGAEVDPDAFRNSAMEEPPEDWVDPEPEKEQIPETVGSVAGDKCLFNAADFEGYLTIANEDFESWSEKYLAYYGEYYSLDQELIPYTMMYKGEVIPHFMPMTYVQNHDPAMYEKSCSMFGEDFEETYLMMNHGLFTELRRSKMCDDLVLYSGVYDSQLMAAAGTDTVPTQEQLVDAIGSTFTDPVMISTTTDPGIACNFSDTIFVIYASAEAMESLGALSIDSFIHTAEKEILMCADAQYRILDVGIMAVETTDDTEQPCTLYRNYVTVELLKVGE